MMLCCPAPPRNPYFLFSPRMVSVRVAGAAAGVRERRLRRPVLLLLLPARPHAAGAMRRHLRPAGGPAAVPVRLVRRVAPRPRPLPPLRVAAEGLGVPLRGVQDLPPPPPLGDLSVLESGGTPLMPCGPCGLSARIARAPHTMAHPWLCQSHDGSSEPEPRITMGHRDSGSDEPS